MTLQSHVTYADYSTGDAMLDALQEMGVAYLFCNLGSDHPAVIEALAKAKAQNRPMPKVIICPHESVALSAAHGYALVSGQAQAVIVHTDVGTQNLGGALHNAARSRIPVFIFAGETPFSMEGELKGTRNSYVNHLQDVYDQRGIVRPYVKWEYSIRTGKNVKQLIYRALQLAKSDPQGPVYLAGAREVLEEIVTPLPDSSAQWNPIDKIPISMTAMQEIVDALLTASHPLLITSYLGRNEHAVQELTKFCDKLAIPVIEHFSSHMNFSADHPLHLGYHPDDFVASADVIIAIDTDAPWITSRKKPMDACKVFYIDVDPLKEELPLWYMPSQRFIKADSGEALVQLNNYIDTLTINEAFIKERYSRMESIHNTQREAWQAKKQKPAGGVITPEWLSACVNNVIDDETVILNETITNAMTVSQQVPRSKPGTMFGNGGSSLGLSGGAAVGGKLANPDKTFVSLIGDGTFLLTVPSSVFWMSRRYNAPFLTVIYNNQGWNATKQNLLRIHPDGAAKNDDRYWVNFDQPADLAKIAEAAGGAYARTVDNPDELEAVLRQGMHEVKNGRSAVIDVRLAPISNQLD